jgi:hypothetical protein
VTKLDGFKEEHEFLGKEIIPNSDPPKEERNLTLEDSKEKVALCLEKGREFPLKETFVLTRDLESFRANNKAPDQTPNQHKLGRS